MGHVGQWPAFWGLLGAIVYAAPRLTGCIYSTEGRGHLARCCIESATALVVGTIAAAAFVPALATLGHVTAPEIIRASSAAIGLLANPWLPAFIKRATGVGETLLSIFRG